MRPGVLEVALIIVAVIIILLITRISRSARKAAPREQATGKSNRIMTIARKTGLILSLSAVLVIIAGVTMFRWVVQSYIIAFVAMAAGLILVYLSSRKR